MFDASVHRFAADLDVKTLQSLLTFDGGERVDPNEIPSSSAGGEHVWPGVWVLLGAEGAFIVFAIIRRVRMARRNGALVD
jgi:hypothetical protein